MGDPGSRGWHSVKSDNVARLRKSIEGLYGNEKYADLTVIAGPRTFKVHKAVMCPRSAFFRAACKKDTFKEGRENVIRLTTSAEDPEDSDDVKILALMIEFMYYLDYSITTTLHEGDEEAWRLEGRIPQTAANDETLCTHAKVFAVAGKYGIASLKEAAWAKFGAHHRLHHSSAHDLAETIRNIYNSIADPKNSAYPFQEYLLHQITWSEISMWENVELKAAVQSVPGLGYELLIEQTKQLRKAVDV